MATADHSSMRAATILLMVGLAALLGIVGMTFWLGEQAQTSFTRVVAARDARAAAVELRSAIQAAESSQRGFLVSGNEIYLAPYGTAKTLAQRRSAGVIAELRSRNEPAAARLDAIIRSKLAEMDESIALREGRRDEEAFAFFNRNLGKALMDEANVFFAGIIRTADDRLTTAAAEQSRSTARLRWATILGGIVIVAVVGLAAATTLRYTDALSAARDQVAALAAGLEERVKHRTADLARANDEIQRFAHIVSHDLRAPLVNIMGFASELESSMAELRHAVAASSDGEIAAPLRQKLQFATSEDMPEALGFIRSSTTKMDALINAILKLSREGRRSLDLQELDLEKLMRASADAVRHQSAAADGTITVDVDVPSIVSDRLSLEQIVGNLIDNAVKYRSKERPLRIDVRAQAANDGGCRITIADNGRGIAETDLPRVFDMFARVGARDQPGEGIGLAFVNTLVRNLGGRVDVSSQPDAGTTFAITLPRLAPTS